MYNLYFYLIFFVIGIILSVPVVVFSIVFLWLNAPKKIVKPTLSSVVKKSKEAKKLEDVKRTYELFLKYFLESPSDEVVFKEWLEVVAELASNAYASVEMIAELKDKLEAANQGTKKEIGSIIANILKTKKK